MRVPACLLALLLTGCSLGGGSEVGSPACAVGETDGDLEVASWPGSIAPDVLDSFESTHGVVITMHEQGGGADGGAPGGDGVDLRVSSEVASASLLDAGGLLPLSREAIPNLANLAPVFAADLPFDPHGRYTVPFQWGTTGIGLDLGVTGREVPRTWGLLFDAALADEYGLTGEVSVLADPRETLGAALRYLGYSVNSTSTAELSEAEAILAAAIERGVIVDSDGYDERLLSGRTAASHGHSANFLVQFLEVDEPDQYEYFVPQEGGTMWVDTMSIPIDAASPCTAHAFIDFVLDAEQGAALTNWSLTASPNAAAEDFIDPTILANPIIYPAAGVELEFIAGLGDDEADFGRAFRSALGDEGG